MTWDHLHDEDVLFEFKGSKPAQLTEGRFYTGTVDGFADFGVFINIGEHVTGLLHRSKLDRRLESLDWEIGDEVIVQVANVKDNGDIDLDRSIRQTPEEFRGSGVDSPEDSAEVTPDEPEPESPIVEEESAEPATPGLLNVSRVPAAGLAEHISSRVRVEGRIAEVRQTSGPTIFTLTDESGTVDCAAFESAGVRAYPTVEEDDIVRLIGLVEQHRGDIQIEVETIESPEEADKELIQERLADAAQERATPETTELPISDPTLEAHQSALIAAATSIREAIYSGRRVLIRHPTRADAVVAAAGIERAVRAVHSTEDIGTEDPGRWVERRPMNEPWYDLGDAMYDYGAIHEEKTPLVILIGAGTSKQDQAALEFLQLYNIHSLAVDTNVLANTDVNNESVVNVTGGIPTTAVGTAIAAMIAPSVTDDIISLPAISWTGSVPSQYMEAAMGAGLDEETINERRQAISLISYYQRYDDKRELVDDLLFNPEATALAGHISGQYRSKIETAVGIAQENADRISAINTTVCGVYADEHTHRYDFPPYPVLAAELLAKEVVDDSADIVAIFGVDVCYLAGIDTAQLPQIVSSIQAATTDAAVSLARDRITFLSGKRDAVKSALVDAVSSA